MTSIQYKFLESIRNKEKTAKEICKELGIRSKGCDNIGGYYNALNQAIGYLTDDIPGEIDDCFIIQPDNSPYSNNDKYYITDKGRETYDKERDNRRYLFLTILGIVVTILGVVVSILL